MSGKFQSALDALHAKRSSVRHVHVSAGQVPPVQVVGEWSLLVRAFTDLLLTAECCSCGDDTIVMETFRFEDEVCVSISVGVQSLSSEELETFFEVGGQRKLFKADGDFGLGPVLASRIIRLFNGLVSVRNESERGIVIQVTLPIDPTLSAQNTRTR